MITRPIMLVLFLVTAPLAILISLVLLFLQGDRTEEITNQPYNEKLNQHAQISD